MNGDLRLTWNVDVPMPESDPLSLKIELTCDEPLSLTRLRWSQVADALAVIQRQARSNALLGDV
jgi:hypothetical protein